MASDEFDVSPSRRRDANIPNYLAQSILVTLFCCLPAGIVAIIYASGVNGKIASGNFRSAQEASSNAKMWCWIAFGIGIVLGLIQLVVVFIAAVTAAATPPGGGGFPK